MFKFFKKIITFLRSEVPGKCCLCEKMTNERAIYVPRTSSAYIEFAFHSAAYHKSCIEFYLQNKENVEKTKLAIEFARIELVKEQEAEKDREQAQKIFNEASRIANCFSTINKPIIIDEPNKNIQNSEQENKRFSRFN
jgi:hypothetical protein